MWNWTDLNQVFPPDCLQPLMFVKALDANDGRDIVAWLHNASRLFSIRFAYKCCRPVNDAIHKKIYVEIWKLEGPQ